jgi:isopenicillin N synthase-like dioxygenase
MMAQVPRIDISPFRSEDARARDRVAEAVAKACEEIGFFKISHHGVAPDLVAKAFATASEFFDLPQDIKDGSRPARSSSARGYHALRTKNLAKTLGYDNPPDLREQFYIGPLDSRSREFAHIPGAGELYAENIWPQTPARYKEVFSDYYRQLERLGGTLMRIFAVALGVEEGFFDDKIDHHFSTLPANHYPEPDADPLPNQVRAGEHTDFGSLTILAVNGRAAGLQVRLKDASWLDVTAEPDEFIINIGDMMQRWTNDRWVSNLHRVINPPTGQRAGTKRMSMGYFLHPNYDAEIACLPTCRGPDGSERYPPVRAGDMMRRKLEARAA